ncbi:MAG: hypothetical protein ACK4P3_08505 [Fimbriimonadaceae bacterium]
MNDNLLPKAFLENGAIVAAFGLMLWYGLHFVRRLMDEAREDRLAYRNQIEKFGVVLVELKALLHEALEQVPKTRNL